ncbi:MAG: alpha/beta-hydrolase family protein [Microthrixaceae bacterium]|nr:alpha/beta-hydrolase family protein [Microthrixaceae bacterium]
MTDVVTTELIEETLGEPAVAEPVRAYVGVNSEPVYAAGRSEMMCDEMERLGALDRSHLLLFSPTGTGWVDQAVVSAAELFTRGDMATACVQYGRSPSFLAVQTVALRALAVPAVDVECQAAPRGPPTAAAPEGLRLRREPRSVGILRHRHADRHRGARALRGGPGALVRSARSGQVVTNRHA